ncbi:hypothetical protein DL89DRAFT_88010 [Linderina pennispora]|uniref:Uncharacterized protein n=1 Tax=Linderina pennispora TaxID=61395 RepID=A0A1Y1WHV6_9FUNG|nr:uncharacterized protein DL89DRAFT_88010 [Linderina pennispora]ORX73097.1 hypothetical protein DL89DRAFT_88010 [Linderina pennispora]
MPKIHVAPLSRRLLDSEYAASPIGKDAESLTALALALFIWASAQAAGRRTKKKYPWAPICQYYACLITVVGGEVRRLLFAGACARMWAGRGCRGRVEIPPSGSASLASIQAA